MLQIKRIYEAPAGNDGYRILVDRLWPRGVSKEKAALDEWLKDIAPSPMLRKWFGHDPARFAEFSTRYEAELSTNPAVKHLLQLMDEHETITLLYGARDPNCNHAIVLMRFLSKQGRNPLNC